GLPSVERNSVQLGARIKPEDGLEGSELGGWFRLRQLTLEILTRRRGAQPVDIHMEDPGGVGGDVAALHGSAAGSQSRRQQPTGPGAKKVFQMLHIVFQN